MIAVVLRRGDGWREGVALVGQGDFDGHVAYVTELRDKGVAVEIGPLADPELQTSDDLVGLALLDLDSVNEARALMDKDPMVRAAVLSAHVYLWGFTRLSREASS